MQTKQVRLLKIVISIVILVVIGLNILQINTRTNTIYIGTKNLTEQQIIANIYKEAIEANTDYEVRIISGMDTTAFVHSALLNNDLDMYVEYSSTAYLEVFKHEFDNQTKDVILQELESDYQEVGLDLNAPLGFENSNAIICSEYCEGMTNISELSGKEFSFAAPAYFFERSDGYNLLEEAYDLSNVEILKADPIVIYTGIISGQIDVGLGFTTDAKLAREQINILKDTDIIFPSYDAILVTNDSVISEYPQIEPILKQINGTISTKEIQDLNDQVENQGIPAVDVARSFAQQKNYL